MGTGRPGAVMLAVLVAFAGGEVGMVPLPVVVGRVPEAEVALPGKVLVRPVPDGGVPTAEVPLDGTGKTTVVEVMGTTTLVAKEAVALVETVKDSVVEFRGTTTLVVAEVVALVGRGKDSVVEFKGRTTLVDATGDPDALLGAVSEGGTVGAVVLEVVGAPVPDGSRVDAELLLVGGGTGLADPESGSEVAVPADNGTKSVVELVMMTTLVAAAVPLTLIVVRLPVMAPADRIVLPGMTDSEDELEVGKGAASVVVSMGMMTLVAAAVSLMPTVEILAVITPLELVAVSGAAAL